ncbi:MAG TPA: DNA mismatch repair protein MutS [Candidatus Limiplasma sp.]|nr:DNA mismatch repair protein MutS [Candidatus Limiplasma sp.]HRX08465.1 DNA mismatch repair protein MutS [Candidatus Limiplasma sp.]
MNTHHKTLEFPIVLKKLKSFAVSDSAREILDTLEPFLSEQICIQRMAETTAARRVLDAFGSPPLPMMTKLEESITHAEIGTMLSPEQLNGVSMFASSCKCMVSYLSRIASQDATLHSYGQAIHTLGDLQEEIQRCILEDEVRDEASALLRDLRRKMLNLEAKIKDKLNQILRTHKQYMTDGYITNRGGHYVLPVKKQNQKQVPGAVIDTSSTGTTVFIEPAAAAALREELDAVRISEDEETRRVLYTLSAQVAEEAHAIRSNMKLLTELDVLFAKGKLSAAMDAHPVQIGGERKLIIRNGRHPLLDPETCVPLNLRLEDGDRGVIITGPNTGGKTVAIKTVGLLTLMAQCGLHIPCDPESYIAMQDGIWCDIGDSQNISQNLSTFSGHITNVIHILKNASKDSLVLLDELGSGTDPAEGMGIGIAVLEELRLRGCMFMVTTHYPQIKTYAKSAEHILRARMAFDAETLAPQYRLEMGKTGESCALQIAQRLGLDRQMLDRAHRAVYDGEETALADTPAMAAPKSRLTRQGPPPRQKFTKFTMGDSVVVLPEKEKGIVYRPADDNGDVIVQVKGVKRVVKHTRVQLVVSAAELYPPDYDFSIVFDTVKNRKASHILSKRYDPDAVIEYETLKTE